MLPTTTESRYLGDLGDRSLHPSDEGGYMEFSQAWVFIYPMKGLSMKFSLDWSSSKTASLYMRSYYKGVFMQAGIRRRKPS